MTKNWNTPKWNFNQILIVSDKSLVKCVSAEAVQGVSGFAEKLSTSHTLDIPFSALERLK